MMFIPDVATVKNAVTREAAGKYFSEASTLGLSPGEWPDFIVLMLNEKDGALFQRTRFAGNGARRRVPVANWLRADSGERLRMTVRAARLPGGERWPQEVDRR